MHPLAERFNALFDGLKRAHGRYLVGQTTTSAGKVEGRASTIQSPVTLQLWLSHLEGKVGLGVIPAREDGLLRFGAIDIDTYPLDLEALVAKITAMGLPLIVTRTKSGGAHCWYFTQTPQDGDAVRQRLRDYAIALGYRALLEKGKVEIFPKQSIINEDSDTGNWINMPYYGAERSTRYGIKPTGGAMSPEEFLAAAEVMDPPAQLETAPDDYVPPDDDAAPPPWGDEPQDDRQRPAPKSASGGGRSFKGAPPCLKTLAHTGFPEGSRNNGLFNLAVFARKAYPDDWQGIVSEFNQRFMEPPLPDDEVKSIVKSVGRKRYTYKCKDHPIMGVCDRKLCLTQEYGVGGGVQADDAGVTFGEMNKIHVDPIVWVWKVGGADLQLETQELMNQQAFHAKVISKLSIWPPNIKKGAWRGLVQSRMDSATDLYPPTDATGEGQLMEQLSRFCTSRVVGKALDELLMGKPYTDHKNHRTYFISTDFLQYLAQHRFPKRVDESTLYMMLMNKGLEPHRKEIKGVMLAYWSIPAFETQTEDFDVPSKEPDEEAM